MRTSKLIELLKDQAEAYGKKIRQVHMPVWMYELLWQEAQANMVYSPKPVFPMPRTLKFLDVWIAQYFGDSLMVEYQR